MTLDDYKELMKFHIVMSEFNTTTSKYAAVDANGSLWCYNEEPTQDIILRLWENMDALEGCGKVCVMKLPEDWKQTLIEL